jgi:hypothetical protein
MARMKLMARKHVRVPLHRNVVPMESHSDCQNAGYFLRTLRTMLCGNSYLWHVRVVIYERPMANHIRRIGQVVEAPTSRWTFEAGMREAAREALAILRHEMDEQMAHSQYHHFSSQAE